MDAYLRPLVSCRLITTIIRQRKNDIGEIEKIEKYSQTNVYDRIAYKTSCVCVCVCVCIDYFRVLLCMCGHMMIRAYRGRFEVVS